MTPETAPRTTRTYRQRSSQTLAWLFLIAAAVMVVSLLRAWGDNPEPLFLAWLVLGMACAWVVFLRPAVVLDQQGVTLRNLVRNVSIPWPVLSDVEFRWNVRVFAGERGYTAWAVSSQIERPKVSAGGLIGGMGGASSCLGRYSAADTEGAPAPGGAKVTSRYVAELIEQTRAEYVAAVADGEISPVADARVRVRWAVPAIAALAVPAVAIVALTVL